MDYKTHFYTVLVGDVFISVDWGFPISHAGVAYNCLTQSNVWLVILLTTVACLVPGVAFRFVQLELYPTLIDKVRPDCCSSQAQY